MSTQDPDSTQTSRSRLLSAGKMLFARLGYEQTSTAAIAREAGSSESQLIRYFGGKAGLLEAIFNTSWAGMTDGIEQNVAAAEHGRDAILRILSMVIESFSHDHETAFLFLFEGRRIRGSAHEVVLSQGFLKFNELLKGLVQRGQQDGSLRADINPLVLGSALLGTAEGMIRDRLLAERQGQPNPFDENEIRTAFVAVVNGLSPKV